MRGLLGRVGITGLLIVALITAGQVPAAVADPGDVLYSPNVATNPDDRVSYPHAIRLQHSGAANGQILATFERRTTTVGDGALGTVTNPGRGWIIKRSLDGGQTFSDFSFITPAEFPNWPYTVQPHLLELHTASGSYPAGTLLMGVLLANLAVDQTRMQVYRSTNQGASWSHAGNIIVTTSGPRVWEPHLVQLQSGAIAAYYAHEGQGNGPRSQTIVHKLSTDGGSTWGAAVTDWQFPSTPAYYEDRPGMPTVTRMGNGRYIMAIESCGFPGEHCQIRVKTSSDGLTWGSGPTDVGTRVGSTSGNGYSGNPFITWMPGGGPNGRVMIIAGEVTDPLPPYAVTPNTHGIIFENHQNGVGQWSELVAPIEWVPGGTQSGYRSAILPSASGEELLYLTSSWTGSGVRNKIVYGTADSGTIPYADPFDAGRDLGWQTFGGTWATAAGGIYSVTGAATGHKSVAGSTAWHDYVLDADVRLNAAGNAGVLVRVSDADTGADAHAGYFVGISSTTGGVFIGRQNGSWTQLGATRPLAGGVAVGTWYHLTVRAAGCSFQVTAQPDAGGTPTTFTETDSNCFGFGQVGLRTGGPNASWRDVTVASTGDVTAPSTVTGLAARSGHMHAIPLSWTASSDASGRVRYLVYASSSSTVPIAPENLVGTTTTPSFRHGPLAPGTTRYFRVVAVDGSGNASAASSTVSATSAARNSSDVNADGRDDGVVFTHGAGDDVYVATSTGSALNTAAKWHDFFAIDGETPFTADVDGDDRADAITFTRGTTADVYVALSSGSAFGGGVKWHDSFASGDALPLVGDFDGDGRSDIVSFSRGSTGDVRVALSNGSGFGASTLWHDTFAFDGELPVVGDFDGDGRDDIATLTRGSTGDVYVALSTGTGFSGSSWKWHDIFGFDAELPAVGDFNGDGRDDIAIFTRGTLADVHVALSDGLRFVPNPTLWNSNFAPGSEIPGSADLTGDGRSDIVTFTIGTTNDVYVGASTGSAFGVGAKWHDFFGLTGETPRPSLYY